jgi:hypothetical protein
VCRRATDLSVPAYHPPKVHGGSAVRTDLSVPDTKIILWFARPPLCSNFSWLGNKLIRACRLLDRKGSRAMSGSKVLSLEIGSLLITAPMIVWFSLYVAALQSMKLRPVLPWLRVLRWVGWGLGIVFFLAALARNSFPTYGCAMSAFSAGLSLPEGWVKRRFAPDLIEPNPEDEWWPSKRE